LTVAEGFLSLWSGRGYSGGIESDISTVITFSAADNWLREGGTIAFLITWTVFKSESARGFRLSKLPKNAGLQIKLIEDLSRIQPFPDATNERQSMLRQRLNPLRALNSMRQNTKCGCLIMENLEYQRLCL